MPGCDTCLYYEYDEEYDEYSCSVDMDEDDYGRLLSGHYKDCPFYRSDNEYEVVKHQM